MSMVRWVGGRLLSDCGIKVRSAKEPHWRIPCWRQTRKYINHAGMKCTPARVSSVPLLQLVYLFPLLLVGRDVLRLYGALCPATEIIGGRIFPSTSPAHPSVEIHAADGCGFFSLPQQTTLRLCHQPKGHPSVNAVCTLRV